MAPKYPKLNQDYRPLPNCQPVSWTREQDSQDDVEALWNPYAHKENLSNRSTLLARMTIARLAVNH